MSSTANNKMLRDVVQCLSVNKMYCSVSFSLPASSVSAMSVCFYRALLDSSSWSDYITVCMRHLLRLLNNNRQKTYHRCTYFTADAAELWKSSDNWTWQLFVRRLRWRRFVQPKAAGQAYPTVVRIVAILSLVWQWCDAGANSQNVLTKNLGKNFAKEVLLNDGAILAIN